MNSSISTLLLLVGFLGTSASNANNSTSVNSYRLSPNVIPVSYNIWLRPYLLVSDALRQFTFDGEVNITLHTMLTGVRKITLHKYLIDITGAWLYKYNNNSNGEELLQTFSIHNFTYHEATHKLAVHLEEQLKPTNNYTLRFTYTGQIRDGMQGFFRANYTDSSGNEKLIGLTQSQRIDARSIFPCFDEPAYKATFRFQLSRPMQYNTVFNTELLESIPDGDERFLDRFATTPLMSTYLFAFIVSEFVKHGDEDINIITRVEYENKTDFAYQVAKQSIKAYDAYTEQPYKNMGLPTLQKAESPKFLYSGMENWGLVIYSDKVLVIEPGYTDGWSNKEYTIAIILHETAHMWFGNSVTFAWWSYFWLNEAFARYYQYFMAQKLYPEYQFDEQFVVNQVHMIFGIDAGNTAQPMTSPEANIQTPTEIGYKFSSIAYAKGAAILRMIANLMGTDNFDKAIRAYLNEFHLKNTVPNDLFKHFKRRWPTKPQVDLDQFFYDWTEQVGFPVLYVSVNAARNVKLTQERFLLDPANGSNSALSYTIPVTYATDTEPDFHNLTARFYFSKSNKMFINEKPIKWIVFNVQQSNYYRVYYDESTLFNIKMALLKSQHSNIPTTNRAQLIDDLFSFGGVAKMDYKTVFMFLEYLAHEKDYLPWYAMFSNLPRISNRLTLKQQAGLLNYLKDTMATVYNHLGFRNTNDTVLDIYNRNKVISWACMYHLFDCDKQAQRLFEAFHKSGDKPTPDFRETLYCSAMRNGTINVYQTLNKWFAEEKLKSEKQKLVRTMGCTRFFFEHHYNRILNGDISSEYATIGIIPMYTQNMENVEAIFIMITDSIEKLAEKLGGWESTADIISDIGNYFTTPAQKRLLDDFITKKGSLFGSSISTLHMAANKVEANLKWADIRLQSLIKYLDTRNAAGISSLALIPLIVISLLHWLI